MTKNTADARRKGGRLTREAQEQLQERIVEVARNLFLEHGYDGVSIEMLCDGMGIAKRTFYHRFKDKAELFSQAIDSIIDLKIASFGEPPSPHGPLRQVLLEMGRWVQAVVTTDGSMPLHHLIMMEARRFPEVARRFDEHSWGRGVRMVAHALRLQAAAGVLAFGDLDFAAGQFQHMIVGETLRRNMISPTTKIASDSAERDLEMTVDLFLRGCLRISPPK